MKEREVRMFGGASVSCSNRTITVKKSDEYQRCNIDYDGVKRLSGIRIDDLTQDGPIRGAYFAVASLLHGIGCDDGRMMEHMVPLHDFLRVMEPVFSNVVGCPVDNPRRIIVAAYTAFAMKWCLEEEYDDIFERRHIIGVFDCETYFEPDGMGILYIALPDSFDFLLHLVADEGFKVVIA